MKRVILFLSLFAASTSLAQEYRAYWVETFNTPLGSADDVDRVVAAAVDGNANALFVQVRRRGDSWYLDSKEPLAESLGGTFDPLRYLIDQAHARSIEVHAFVIIGAIYQSDPAIRLPSDSRHVFLQHVWDAAARAPYTGSRQWATRALPHNTSGTTYDGMRFAGEWYVDLGHPDAAAYTVDVLTHLVRNYAVDGIHLDRIRYPEAPIDAGGGINVGYNETSVARFNARHRRSGNPATDDALWNDWRRDQVTRFVRRLYLSAKAVRPAVRVSAALICFGAGPSASGGFERTEAYARVFQDWKSWSEEGILDLIAPMDYKREHVASQAAQFDDWMRFTVQLARDNGRRSLIGLGVYLNAIEGTLRQIRRARESGADGAIFYSLAATNTAVSPNPFSYPTANQPTPQRSAADFQSALKTGASADGSTRFEPPTLTPLFMQPVATPDVPRNRGHLMGFLEGTDGTTVEIVNLSTAARRTVTTDGGGFFGAAHLEPGTYRVTSGDGRGACSVRVEAGLVAAATMAPSVCAPRRRAAW